MKTRTRCKLCGASGKVVRVIKRKDESLIRNVYDCPKCKESKYNKE